MLDRCRIAEAGKKVLYSIRACSLVEGLNGVTDRRKTAKNLADSRKN